MVEIKDRIFRAIEYLPREANTYVNKLARLKAYEKDPKFREIEDRRHVGTFYGRAFFGPGLGVEDWIYQHRKAEDLTPSLRRWQTVQDLSHRPREWDRKARHAVQRMRRGYDDWAVHDFRSWHAHYVAKALREYVAIMHGHPADRTFEQWKVDIDLLASKFEAIAEDAFEDQSMVDDAMSEFAKVYLHLWD